MKKENSFEIVIENKDKILNFIEEHGYLFDNEILESLVKSKKNNMFINISPLNPESKIAKFELIKLLSEIEFWLENSMYEEDKVIGDIEFINTLIGCIEYSILKNFTFINIEGVEYYGDVCKMSKNINNSIKYLRGTIIPSYGSSLENLNNSFKSLNDILCRLLVKLCR